VDSFALDQNYPNPFNPETTIRYRIPNPGVVELTVCSTIVQKVRTLLNSREKRGEHAVQWDGRDDFGKRVPSGVYLYRLKTSGSFAFKKMLLLK
jgi:flagellar hook assembly protein FlgD